MKKIILLLVGILTLASATAQVTISAEEWNNLSPDVKAQIEEASKIERVSKYAGLGKEIGTAVSETLDAVKDSATEIAETKLGKTAIGIVVWKLLWKDVLKIIVGLVLLILCMVYGREVLDRDRWKVDEEGIVGIPLVVSLVLFGASMMVFFV